MTRIGVDTEVPPDLRGEDINESELSRKNLDTLTAPTKNITIGTLTDNTIVLFFSYRSLNSL